jgi:hypothetical protein
VIAELPATGAAYTPPAAPCTTPSFAPTPEKLIEYPAPLIGLCEGSGVIPDKSRDVIVPPGGRIGVERLTENESALRALALSRRLAAQNKTTGIFMLISSFLFLKTAYGKTIHTFIEYSEDISCFSVFNTTHGTLYAQPLRCGECVAPQSPVEAMGPRKRGNPKPPIS